MRPITATAVAGAAGAALLLGLWAWQRNGTHEPVRLLTGSSAPAVSTGAKPAGSVPARPATAAASSPEAFMQWLGEHSSLRGAALDGAWGELDAGGRLKPAIALRRRFDQLLTLQGETTLEQITAFAEHDARAALGADGARQVMEVWRRYLELLRYTFRSRVDLRDRHSWAAALAERQPVRRNLLGAEWAAAFYAEEEAQLLATLQEPVQPADAPPAANAAGIDVAALPPEARQRLAVEQAAWADWERRLASARQEWARLQQAAELSAPQRAAAMEQWMRARFDAGEQRRVRALLQLPRLPHELTTIGAPRTDRASIP
ncbi:lipase chaperone [Methylibium rhizosphaerae]|uniref:lipase chaperone n=1 Tax=Methylibium rhizosphaerae TaxID=2570323 RepID=UPI00112D34AC|nr:lipase chaperone [Methylibium rhizosphaerae]